MKEHSGQRQVSTDLLSVKTLLDVNLVMLMKKEAERRSNIIAGAGFRISIH